MRLAAVLLALLLVCGLSAVARAGPASPGFPDASKAVLDVGDSLSLGTGPYLRARLRGYEIDRLYDVGLHAYDVAGIVATAKASLPSVLVVSAGTNDDPRMVATFIRSVSRVLTTVGSDRCVVWPTIVRPAAVGASYDGLNRALTRAAGRHENLVLVDWVRMVGSHPSWLSEDGVHVSAAGYRARAAAIAAAVKVRCRNVIG